MNRPLLLAIVLCCVVAGCSVRTADYYKASAPQGVIETKGSTCSGPTAIYQFPIGDGAAGSIQAHPSPGFVVISISLSLKENRTVRLSNSEMRITDPSTKSTTQGLISNFRISVFGQDGKPGHIETFEPTAELRGSNRNPMRSIPLLGQVDSFNAAVRIPSRQLDSFMLELPVLIADGTAIQVPPIEFGRKEQTYILACVQ